VSEQRRVAGADSSFRKALKEGREPALDKPLAAETEVELRLPAFLPATYIGDVHVRLALYKRIAASENAQELDDLTAEMIDRFSNPPPQAQNLLRIARLKLTARALGIRRLDLGPQGGTVVFEERNQIDPAAVIRMLQKAPREYRLEGPLKLRISRPMEKEEMRFEFAAELLKRLTTATAAPAAAAASKSAMAVSGGQSGKAAATAGAPAGAAANSASQAAKNTNSGSGSQPAKKPVSGKRG